VLYEQSDFEALNAATKARAHARAQCNRRDHRHPARVPACHNPDRALCAVSSPPRPPAALQAYDAQRDTIIRRSRDMQKAAKTAIYCLHRADVAGAAREIASVEGLARELLPPIVAEPTLRYGSFSAAMEEYAEAAIFAHYLSHGRLLPSSALPLASRDEYIGGLLDFTGELNRFAVLRATARDVAAVARCRELVDAIFGAMLQFDLRNSPIRKKFDSLKYTLKKMESLLYELSLASPVTSTRMDVDAEPRGGAQAGNAGGDAGDAAEEA
jgi:predicted translin family RNA/ssDNA-binding protein